MGKSQSEDLKDSYRQFHLDSGTIGGPSSALVRVPIEAVEVLITALLIKRFAIWCYAILHLWTDSNRLQALLTNTCTPKSILRRWYSEGSSCGARFTEVVEALYNTNKRFFNKEDLSLVELPGMASMKSSLRNVEDEQALLTLRYIVKIHLIDTFN